MNNITRENPRFSDDEIRNLVRTVEHHDFERIAPPPQVWNNVLAEAGMAVASQSASARRRPSQWFSTPLLMSAAAVTLLMVGVAVAVVADRGDDASRQQLAEAVAVMTDDGLPVPTDETAQARVVCDRDESCFVEVDLTAVPDPGGAADLELWIINSDVTDMHSLGLVDDSGSFPLPAGVDPEDFPIVDISVEPRDGEAAHSGQSVLRGVFKKS